MFYSNNDMNQNMSNWRRKKTKNADIKNVSLQNVPKSLKSILLYTYNDIILPTVSSNLDLWCETYTVKFFSQYKHHKITKCAVKDGIHYW